MHNHIVELLACFIKFDDDLEEYLYILMPLATHGDLYQWLRADIAPDCYYGVSIQDFLYSSSYSLVEALAYLHSSTSGQWTGHFDIKPRNILLFEEYGKTIMKLSDFGHTRLRSDGGDSGTRRQDGLGTEEYLPPEYDGIKKTYPIAFDVFSMACVLLELATMITFPDRKPNMVTMFFNKRINATSSRSDPSFRNSMNEVMKWMQHLEASNGSPKLKDFLSTVKDMLHESPSQRILACEAALDLWQVENPEKGNIAFREASSKLIEGHKFDRRFWDHNPLKRNHIPARNYEWRVIRDKCFLEAGWPGAQVRDCRTARSLEDRSFSTLPGIFEQAPFIGRAELLQNLTIAFNIRKVTILALHGLGGIGKSHVAWKYVMDEKHKANDMNKTLHTFWVQAQSPSAFERSYFQIAERIGIQPNSQDMMQRVQRWLEDPLNGSWIIVLDGVDSTYEQCPWKQYCPWSGGRILITSKDQGISGSYCSVNNSFKVNELDAEESNTLLQIYAECRRSEDEPSIKALAQALQLPILIKLMGRYINLNSAGGETSQTIWKWLQNEDRLLTYVSQQAVQQLGFEWINPHAQRGFDLLFESFGPGKTNEKYRRSLNILSFYDSQMITLDLLRAEFKPEVPAAAEKAFNKLTHLSYLERKDRADSLDASSVCYSIHPLIQDLWIMSQKCHGQRGKEDVWNGYMRMLSAIARHYSMTREKEKLAARSERLSIHDLKIGYKIHFERFVKSLRDDPDIRFKFSTSAATSIVTFSRLFRNENRFGDAAYVLQRVLEHGIRPDKGHTSDCTRVKIRVCRSLAGTYRDQASGRARSKHLKMAFEQFRVALNVAVGADYADIVWKCRADLIMISCEIGVDIVLHTKNEWSGDQEIRFLFDALLQYTANLPLAEQQDLELRIAKCHAYVLRYEGIISSQSEKMDRALSAWNRYTELLEASPFDHFHRREERNIARSEKAEILIRKLDMITPETAPGYDVDEAWMLHQQHYWEVEKGLPPSTKLGQRIRCQQAAAQLRTAIWIGETGNVREVEDCYTTFREGLTNYIEILKAGIEDPDVRICAYLLRETVCYLIGSEWKRRDWAQMWRPCMKGDERLESMLNMKRRWKALKDYGKTLHEVERRFQMTLCPWEFIRVGEIG